MKVIAYTRISTDQQDLDKQRHLLLGHAQRQGWLIDEFIEVAASSRKDTKSRKIDELLPENTLKKNIIKYSLILLAIVNYPFIICLFPKGLWFFVLSSAGIWYQFYNSVAVSIYPYSQFIVLFMFNIMFMGVLACLYPFGNFIELTPFNLVVLALYLMLLYLGGSFFLQKKIGSEKLMK